MNELKYKLKRLFQNKLIKYSAIGLVALIVIVVVVLVMGKKDNQVQVTTAINDYNGCENRIEGVQQDIQTLMNEVMNRNLEIKEGNPSNYWADDSFQEFLTDTVDMSTFTHTAFFNEEQTSWEEVETMVKDSFDEQTTFDLKRNDKDDYVLSWDEQTYKDSYWLNEGTSVNATRRIYAKYSSNNDWLQNVEWVTSPNFVQNDGNNGKYNTNIFEYAREKDVVVIQTSTERILIRYKKKYETDEEGKKVEVGEEIAEFYYSKLDGSERNDLDSDRVYEEDDYSNADQYIKRYTTTTNGYILNRYNESDSFFTEFSTPSEITPSWVFGSNNYTQTIAYDGKVINITTLNKLSKKYESYAFNMKTGKEVKAKDNVKKTEKTAKKEEEKPHSYELYEKDDNYVVLYSDQDTVYNRTIMGGEEYLVSETSQIKYKVIEYSEDDKSVTLLIINDDDFIDTTEEVSDEKATDNSLEEANDEETNDEETDDE